MKMHIETGQARNFWDSEIAVHTHSDWMANPEVRDYLNRTIGEERMLWPLDWLEEKLGGRRFERVLSIGCGAGALERDVIRRGLATQVDAFDGSVGSLAMARELAAAEQMSDRIRYFASDFNEPVLPRGVYDGVFFHHSLHHVAKIEKLLRAVMHALTPDGLLYIDEYVGPSRHMWNDESFAATRELFNRVVPEEARVFRELPLPIVPDDPSEAVRSGEILEQLRVGFDVIAQRHYGGNVLSLFYPAVNWNVAPQGLLTRLIQEEKRLLQAGATPYLMLVIACPKRAAAKLIASARYFTEPKVKRVGREVRAFVSRRRRSN